MTKQKKCPVCGRPRVNEHTPFCSARCKDRDFMRWLNEGYTIPGPPAPTEDEPR